MKNDDSAEQLEAAAAAWVFRRGAGLTAAEQDELDQWRAADPRRDAALAQYEQAWSALDRPRSRGQAGLVLHQLGQRASRRRRRRFAGLTAAAAMLIALVVLWPPEPSRSVSDLQARVVRPETRTLPDGSVVELKSGAEIAVEFGASSRRILLRRGTAHFSVAHESRPFVVATGDVAFRAVGTAFGVHLAENQVELLVTEGRVAVAPADEAADERNASTSHSATPHARPGGTPFESGRVQRANAAEPGRVALPSGLLVPAGNRVVVGLTAQRAALLVPPTFIPADELAERLAWRAPRLEFTETSLTEAVALMNAHNRVQLVVRDAELGKLRVSGLFRADRATAFVRLLEVNFDVSTEERGETIYLYRKR